MMGHAVDPLTRFCRRCGAGEQEIAEGKRAPECCVDAANVIGVSHRIAERRFQILIRTPRSRASAPRLLPTRLSTPC